MNRNERDNLCEELIDHYQELSERVGYVECPLYYTLNIHSFMRRDNKTITEEWLKEQFDKVMQISCCNREHKHIKYFE